MLTDATGGVVEESDFYPYGGERVITDSLDNNYKFTGHERDTESGLDHTWFRQLSSTLGRWTSADPLAGSCSNPQTLNRYAYVSNNPTNLVDPTGQFEVSLRDPTVQFEDPSGIGGRPLPGACPPPIGGGIILSAGFLPGEQVCLPEPIDLSRRAERRIEGAILQKRKEISGLSPFGALCDCFLDVGLIRVLGCNYICGCSDGILRDFFKKCSVLDKNWWRLCPTTVVMEVTAGAQFGGIKVLRWPANFCN